MSEKIRKITNHFFSVNWTKFKIQETENSSHFKINDRSFTSVLLNIKKGLHMIFSVFKFGATEPLQSSIYPTRFLVSQFHICYFSTKFICLEYKAGSRFISQTATSFHDKGLYRSTQTNIVILNMRLCLQNFIEIADFQSL